LHELLEGCGKDISFPSLEEIVSEMDDRPFECLQALIDRLADELDYLDKSPFYLACSSSMEGTGKPTRSVPFIVDRHAYERALHELVEATMSEYMKPIERAFIRAHVWAFDRPEHETAIGALRAANECIGSLSRCRETDWSSYMPRLKGFDDALVQWVATSERFDLVRELIITDGAILSVREMQLGHVPKRLLSKIGGELQLGPQIAASAGKQYDPNARKALSKLKKEGFIENRRGRGYRRRPRMSLF